MVTWSLDAGAPPRVVQHDAGHAQFRTTEIYVHRLDKRVSGARLDAMATMYARMNDEIPSESRPAATDDQRLAELLAALPSDRIADVLATVLARRDSPRLRAVESRVEA